MIEKLSQQHPKIYKHFFTVTTFSKLVALSLFIILPFAGFYLGMKYQTNLTTEPSLQEIQNAFNAPVQKSLPTPTQIPISITPGPSVIPLPIYTFKEGDYSNWLTFTSPRGDYSVKYPSTWKTGGPVSSADTTDVYISMPLPTGFNEGGPYVFIHKTTNTKNSDFLTFITENFPSIKQSIKVVDVQIGEYKVKEVDGLPGHLSNIDIFFPSKNNSYIDVTLQDYIIDTTKTSIPTFEKILASFKLL